MTPDQRDVNLFPDEDGWSARPAWQVIEAARRQRLTGELSLDVDPPARLYLRDGQVYFAERTTDGALSVRLLVEGVLTREQMQRGKVVVNGVEHLGRLFERDDSVDRASVELCVELFTEDVLTSVALEAAQGYRMVMYKRHPNGVDRWFPETSTVIVHAPDAPTQPAAVPAAPPADEPVTEATDPADPAVEWASDGAPPTADAEPDELVVDAVEPAADDVAEPVTDAAEPATDTADLADEPAAESTADAAAGPADVPEPPAATPARTVPVLPTLPTLPRPTRAAARPQPEPTRELPIDDLDQIVAAVTREPAAPPAATPAPVQAADEPAEDASFDAGSIADEVAEAVRRALEAIDAAARPPADISPADIIGAEQPTAADSTPA